MTPKIDIDALKNFKKIKNNEAEIWQKIKKNQSQLKIFVAIVDTWLEYNL